MRPLALLLLLAACAEKHPGPPSPRPEDEESNLASDASDDSNAAEDTESGAKDCTENVEINGTSPFGPLRITQLEASYWGGFTSGTSLLARGSAGGQALELTVSVYTLWTGSRDSACPAGQYWLRDGVSEHNELFVRVRRRGNPEIESLHNAELHVARHETPAPPKVLKAGSPIRFEGSLTISEPGWLLTLPFALRTACDVGVDL